MPSYSKAILMGHLTRDPELRYTGSETAVASFGIAVSHKYKDKEDTSFFDVTAFGKLAELCNTYLSKGSLALVDGRLSQRRWETDDGQKRSKVEVVAETVQFLTKKDKGEGPIDEGDIPF